MLLLIFKRDRDLYILKKMTANVTPYQNDHPFKDFGERDGYGHASNSKENF